MAYSGVFVFGDSLVDAGNALKLAQWYGTLTLSELPDGAPTAQDGYYQGRFTNGYNFADLITNSIVGTVTRPVFPYGYEDPWFDLPIAPWASDPSGNNLNFAYGGAQIKQGKEVVSDLDAQTDAFRDAVDGSADPNALYMVTVGGNDIRSLAPQTSSPTSKLEAYAILESRAQIMLHELSQLVTMDGVRNILITGMADVGLVARYDRDGDNRLGPDIDLNGDGILDAGEATRAAAATDYSRYLDHLIRTEVIPGLEDLGAVVTYVPLMDYVDEATGQPVTGALSANLNTIAVLNGVTPDAPDETPAQELSQNLLKYDHLLFFDGLHPNAQANALLGSYMHAQLNGTDWVETIPYLGAEVDYAALGTISASREIDSLSVALAANTSYTFQMLGVSSLTPYVTGELGIASLPAAPIVGDPMARLFTARGVMVAADDNSGAGFDSSLVFNVTAAGTYALQLSAIGALTGSYAWTATVSGAAQGSSTYTVDSAATLVIESANWSGTDTVKASVSYALAAGSHVEVLQTTNAKGKGSINLTGNEFGQAITGNAGANVIEGKGGRDDLRGGNGNDRFVLGMDAVVNRDGSQIDRILDYASGDVVDLTQIIRVAAGTNLASGGFVRVTTTGKIQVDVDGGANDWATLSTINGTGSVAVRYMSGSTVATTTLARAAETYSAASSSTMLLSAAVAAAGMLSQPIAAETQDAAVADTSHDGATLARSSTVLAPLQTASPDAVSPGTFDQRPVESIGSAREVDAATSPGKDFAFRRSDGEGRETARVELDTGTTLSAGDAATPSIVAPAVVLPPAELLEGHAAATGSARSTGEVGRVLMDALSGGASDGPSIDSLLGSLPAAAQDLAANAAGVTTGAVAGISTHASSWFSFNVVEARFSADVFNVDGGVHPV